MNEEDQNVRLRANTRRGFLGAGLTGSAALALLGCGGGRSHRADDANAPQPQPQPRAGSAYAGASSVVADEPTVCVATQDNIEGPYFKAGAPNRASLVDRATEGTRFSVSGRIVDVACSPISQVKMDIWQANHKGEYDNSGYTLRGKMITDEKGRYQLDTIIPGRYLNGRQYRPAHIHVMLAAPGYQSLTTQLYFEGDPYNDVDPWIRESLVMALSDGSGGGKRADFDFVLAKA